MTKESKTQATTSANPFAQWDLATNRNKAIARVDEPTATVVDQGNQDTFTAAPQESEEGQVDTKEIVETTPAASETPVTPTTEVTPAKDELKSNDPEATWAKRYADLRKMDQDRLNKINDLQKEIDALKKKPDLSKIKTDEELADFEANNPELYSLIESVALRKSGDVQKKVDELEEQQKALAREKAMQALLKRHPDAEEIKLDPKFKEWYDDQSIRIQDMLANGDLEDICRGLDMYKSDVGISKAKSKAEVKKEEQAQAATTVNGSSSKGVVADTQKQWRESEIHTMNDKLYQKLRPEIDAARREGRIIFEM